MATLLHYGVRRVVNSKTELERRGTHNPCSYDLLKIANSAFRSNKLFFSLFDFIDTLPLVHICFVKKNKLI